MKVAVISDIHGNIEALKTVLQDIENQRVDRIYCTGDLVGYAPFPDEVIDLIREWGIPTVMGNYDDAIGNMRFICGCEYKDEKAYALGERSISWTIQHTSEKSKEYLKNLPQKIRFNDGDRRVMLVHGSPRRLNEYIFEDTPDEYLIDLFNQIKADVLICGHTHKPFYKLIGDKNIINAGSVGKPKHGDPRASYVVIAFENKVEVDIRMIPYNFEVTAQAIEQSDLPNEFADLIRRGIG